MDSWGSSGKRSDPQGIALAEQITAQNVWPAFDGWCASQNVEPLELPWERFINLGYFFIIRNMDKKRRDEFDRHLERQGHQVRIRMESQEQAVSHESLDNDYVTDSVKERRKRLPTPPPGWGDGTDSARSSFMAAQVLKVRQ